jgi:hypothetical protein
MSLPCTENNIFQANYSAFQLSSLSIFSEEATSRAGAPGWHIYDGFTASDFFTCFNDFVDGIAFDQ